MHDNYLFQVMAHMDSIIHTVRSSFSVKYNQEIILPAQSFTLGHGTHGHHNGYNGQHYPSGNELNFYNRTPKLIQKYYNLQLIYNSIYIKFGFVIASFYCNCVIVLLSLQLITTTRIKIAVKEPFTRFNIRNDPIKSIRSDDHLLLVI